MASPFVSVGNTLPEHLTHISTHSAAHSLAHNPSPSMPITTFTHFHEPLHSIQSEFLPNCSKFGPKDDTLRPVSSMSNAHITGYVPVTTHTGQFLPVSSSASSAHVSGYGPVKTHTGQFLPVSSSASSAHITGYVPVTTHTGQFLVSTSFLISKFFTSCWHRLHTCYLVFR